MSTYRTLKEVNEIINNNENRLKSCPHHEFFKATDCGLYNFFYVCKNCGGKVDLKAKKLYEIGYAHGLQAQAHLLHSASLPSPKVNT